MLENIFNGVVIGAFALLTAAAIGALAGVTRACWKWSQATLLHKFNKNGGSTFLILSGSPEAVQQMYEVCVRVANTIVEKQQNEGIPVKDDSQEKS